MAIINKTGITTGGTIQAEHVTRAIDALSGGSTDTVAATGSFSGSFRGTLTGTASFALNAPSIFSLVTGSTYTNGVSGGDNIDLIITGSITTYAQAGNKGLQGYVNVTNALGVFGEIVSGDTSATIGNYPIVYMDGGARWQSVVQQEYDDVTQPLLGIALDKKIAGNVLLNGYITAYTTGSTSGSGMQFATATAPRAGYTVWVNEGSDSGSISVDKPTGGPIISIGQIIASGSTVAHAGNRLIRVNPRYITTI